MVVSMISNGSLPRSGYTIASDVAMPITSVVLRFIRCLLRVQFWPLEDVFQGELHLAVVRYSGCDLAEVRTAQAPGRRAELGSIQEVERLPTKLDFVRFLNADVFKNRKIPGLLRRSVKQTHSGVAVALGSQKDSIARTAVALGPYECAGIEPVARGPSLHHPIHALSCNHVRSRIAPNSRVVRIARLRDGDRQTGGQLKNPIDGPPSQ